MRNSFLFLLIFIHYFFTKTFLHRSEKEQLVCHIKKIFVFPACKLLLPKLLRNLKRNFQWPFPHRSSSAGKDKSSRMPENFAAVNPAPPRGWTALIGNQHDAGCSMLDEYQESRIEWTFHRHVFVILPTKRKKSRLNTLTCTLDSYKLLKIS